MNVNARSAKKCCKMHDADYGHSNRANPKKRFARAVKRRGKQDWKRELIGS
jgi:hypothetical protein